MKKLPFYLLLYLLLAGLLLSSCSNLRIITDINRQADFERYRSFDFVENTPSANDPFKEDVGLLSLQEAIRGEMNMRGYWQSHDPDVWIELTYVIEEKIQLVPEPWFYRDGGKKELDTYDFEVYQYREELLIIDLIDAKDDVSIWKGMAIRILTSYDTENKEERLQEAVRLIFEGYPYQSSSTMPISLGQK